MFVFKKSSCLKPQPGAVEVYHCAEFKSFTPPSPFTATSLFKICSVLSVTRHDFTSSGLLVAIYEGTEMQLFRLQHYFQIHQYKMNRKLAVSMGMEIRAGAGLQCQKWFWSCLSTVQGRTLQWEGLFPIRWRSLQSTFLFPVHVALFIKNVHDAKGCPLVHYIFVF